MKKIFISICLLVFIAGCAGKKQDMSESHYKMGLAYLGTDKDYMAIREFEKALKNRPEDSKIHYAIATFYLKKNKLTKAEEYLENAVKLNPSNSDYQNAYASTLASLDKNTQAIKHWKKVIDDPGYPNHDMAYYNIGYSFYQKHNYKSALKYFEKSIEVNKRFMSPYMYMYRIYKKLDNYNKAVGILKKAVKENPVYMPVRLELGTYYYNNGKYSPAAEEFEKIIEIDPESEEAKSAISYLKEMGIYYE